MKRKKVEGQEEKPKSPMKAYKYRLYASKKTISTLEWTLRRCCELYNAGLAERKEAWRMNGLSITYNDQQNDLPEIKESLRPDYQQIGAHVLQDVLRRLDKAYQAFFRRIKNGEKPGHPRFKGQNWYDSFTFRDVAGWKLFDENLDRPKNRKLKLSNIGTVRLVMHRPLGGKIKTCTIKREQNQWYVVFICEVQHEPLSLSSEDVGIDLGITHFAALSNGECIDNPRHYRKAEKKLKRLQQDLSRKKRGSHRRKKAVMKVAKAHRKIKNQRKDFQHKASRSLVNRYQVIGFEDLKASNMSHAPKPKQDETTGQYLPNGAAAKGGLNKSILDAGWRMFTELVCAKAASAGRMVVFVDPQKTSQICSGCGVVKKKELSERWHSCECGVELDRDHNAAINVLTLAHKALSGGTRPTPSKA